MVNISNNLTVAFHLAYFTLTMQVATYIIRCSLSKWLLSFPSPSDLPHIHYTPTYHVYIRYLNPLRLYSNNRTTRYANTANNNYNDDDNNKNNNNNLFNRTLKLCNEDVAIEQCLADS